jgi:hypothetical protein
MATGRRSAGPIRLHAIGLAAALALTTAVAGLADDVAPTAKQIDDLVRDLDSPERARRAAAEQSLLDMGADVLELLPPPDLVDSVAAREALRRIRVKLELQAAEASVEPSRVTLAGPITLRAAIGELANQTDNRLSVEGLPDSVLDRSLDLELDDAVFWRAVDTIARTAGVGWTVHDEDGSVQFVPAGGAPLPVSLSAATAYGVAVEAVTLRDDTLRVEFEVSAEPRLRPLFVEIADADFAAARAGQPLPLFSPKARTELPMTSRAPARFAVLFQRPDFLGAGDAFGLRGKVVVHTAAAPTDVRFDDLTARGRVARRRGGVTVTLERVRWLPSPDGQGARIAMSVAYDAGGPEFESHRTWIYHNEVYLEDPDGRRYPVNDGFDTTAQANGGVALEYRFKELPDRPPSDWQLIYVAPTLLVDVPVEFEFPMLTAGADAGN